MTSGLPGVPLGVANRRPLRVAFLQGWLTIGGAERIVQTLVQRLDRSRVEPLVVNLYSPGVIGEELEAEGYRSISRLTRSRWNPLVGRKLSRLWSSERIDVVHVYDSALPMFWSGLVRRLHSRPRLVLAFHSTGKLGDPVQHFMANRMTLPVADRFISLAETHRAYLTEKLGIDASRCAVLPTGIDVKRYSPRARSSEARRALGLPEHGPLVALVAALRPEKNHGMFVEVARRVRSTHPEAHFLVVGDGVQRPAIEAAIRSAGLGGSMHLLGARSDLALLWTQIDIAVLTSHPVVETLPVTLLEAHACGVPAVATDVGSVREIVREAETGHLVPPGDIAGFTDRLSSLLRDTERRVDYGIAARRSVEARFDLAQMVRGYEDLFLDVAGTS